MKNLMETGSRWVTSVFLSSFDEPGIMRIINEEVEFNKLLMTVQSMTAKG